MQVLAQLHVTATWITILQRAMAGINFVVWVSWFHILQSPLWKRSFLWRYQMQISLANQGQLPIQSSGPSTAKVLWSTMPRDKQQPCLPPSWHSLVWYICCFSCCRSHWQFLVLIWPLPGWFAWWFAYRILFIWNHGKQNRWLSLLTILTNHLPLQFHVPHLVNQHRFFPVSFPPWAQPSDFIISALISLQLFQEGDVLAAIHPMLTSCEANCLLLPLTSVILFIPYSLQL